MFHMYGRIRLTARIVTVLVLVICGGRLPLAYADAVTDWNAITAQATVTAIGAGRPGLVTCVDFAIVHIAIHDAVQAFDKRFAPYHATIANASGSPVAAVATAAREVLLNLFPAQAASLNTQYTDYLTSQNLSVNDPGVTVGQQAAAAILARRANDGRFPANFPPLTGGTDPGVWRPTPSFLPGAPPSLAPGAVPWLGTVTPFALKSSSQYRAAPPHKLSSKRYAVDYNEVKALGALQNSSRTAEQTDLAYFYADNGFVQWNRAVRAIAAERINNLGDSARLFALLNIAIADAIITAWDSKYFYVFWRPITAIQEGDNDGNSRTQGDPTWQPLINTPNYPEHTSGANNISGAATRILDLFFDTDDLSFTVTSNHPLAVQKSRTYSHLSAAAEDVVDARIYLGIHFRKADEDARRQGQRVAKWVFKRFLRPLK